MPTFNRGQWQVSGTGTLANAVWKSTGVETLQHGEVIPNGSSLGDFIKLRGNLQEAFGDAWATATWDTLRNQLVWTCGTGDQDYASNEVDAFDLTNGSWNFGGRPMDPPTRLWVKDGQTWNSGTTFGNGNQSPHALRDTIGIYHAHATPDLQNGFYLYPNARQHYGGILYMPSVDKIFMWGGFGWQLSGSAMPIPFEWTPSTATWQALTTDLAPVYGNGPLFAWDSALNRVLIFTSDPNASLLAYYPGNAHGVRWATLQSNLADSIPAYGSSSFNYAQCVYDSKRNWLLMFGGQMGCVRWILNGAGSVTSTQRITITGASGPFGQGGPGVLYDPVKDVYVAWGGGATLYEVTPSTLTSMACVAVTPPGATLPSASHFTWQKFAYLPTYDVYAVISQSADSGAFVFAPQRSAPSLAFTDLAVATRSGNTDTSLGQVSGTNGAIVTLWGLNLGQTQSTSTISVGGVTVPSTGIYYWGDAIPPYSPANLNNTYQRMQCVIFQVPSTTPLGSQNISITVGSFTSNNLAITITNTGTIYYVKTAANGGLDGHPGTFSLPFQTIFRAMQVVAANDVVYVGTGVATTGGVDMPAISPLSLVAYPGADCQVGDASHNAFQLNSGGAGFSTTYSKFNVIGLDQAITLRDSSRVVGCKLSAPNGTGSSGTIGNDPFRTTTNNHVFGCEFTNCGGAIPDPNSQYHTLYFSGNRNVGGAGAQESGREAGWNYFHGNLAFRAVNVFNGNVGGTFNNALTNVSIHDNVILNQEEDGILLGNGVVGTNYVYNNLVLNTGLAALGGSGHHTGLHTECSNPPGYTSIGATTLHIYNNTFINCGAIGASSAGAFEFRNSLSVTYDIYNNIVYQANGQRYLNTATTTPPTSGQSHNNCWFGGSDGVPAWELGAVNQNPQVVGSSLPFDCHLRVTSPCIMAGTSPGVASNDLDGVARPTASAWDIGALQFLTVSSPGPSISSLSPGNCAPGSPGFTLTVNGANFQVGSQVSFNGAIRTTTFVTSGQLTASILASDVASAGLFPVVVMNPGGSNSTSVFFQVNIPPATLSIQYLGKLRDCVQPSITPPLAADGHLDGTFVATVGNMQGRSITQLRLTAPVVYLGNPVLAVWTTTANATNYGLGVAITQAGALINSPSTYAVSFTPADGSSFYTFASDDLFTVGLDEFTNGIVFTLTATLSDSTTSVGQWTIGAAPSVPVTTAISVSSGVSGDTVTLTGLNFTPSPSVAFGSASASISASSSTSITCTVPSLSPGTYNVTVTNANGTSNPQSFTVITPTPTPDFNTQTAFMYGQGL